MYTLYYGNESESDSGYFNKSLGYPAAVVTGLVPLSLHFCTQYMPLLKCDTQNPTQLLNKGRKSVISRTPTN